MKRAFTVLEVIIVLTVIGLLVGILLPAIQSSRELARLRQCQSNMMQLSLALGSYHSTYSRFPAGTVGQFSPVQDFPGDYHHSWLVRCLPYLNGDIIVHRLDSSRSIYDPVNRVVRDPNMTPDYLRCSSEPGYSNLMTSNYAAVYSGQDQAIGIDSDGSLVMNHFFRSKDISDGLSNTLMLGEKRIHENDLGWASGTSATLRTTGLAIVPYEVVRSNTGGGWESSWTPPIASEDLDFSQEYAYGWYLGDHQQSLEQYQALTSDEYLETLDSKSPSESQKDSPFVLNIDKGGAKEGHGGNANDNNGNNEEMEEMEESEDNFLGSFYSEVEDSYSLPVAPAIADFDRIDARSFGSYHQANQVTFVYGDGHLASLNPQIDMRTYSQLGNRHDKAPLTRP